MNKKIFLTGASGVIGSKFLHQALEAGYQVRVFTRNANSFQQTNSLEVYQGDLTKECDWSAALLGVDVVVNAAGEFLDKDAMRLVNFDGPNRLLKTAINVGVRRWIQLSSVGAYGSVREGVVDESWKDLPIGYYEKTKSDFDLELIEISRLSNLEVCIVRPSNVYGCSMRNQSIQQMLSAIQKGYLHSLAQRVHLQIMCM